MNSTDNLVVKSLTLIGISSNTRYKIFIIENADVSRENAIRIPECKIFSGWHSAFLSLDLVFSQNPKKANLKILI